jgi:hypothetical protein
MTRTPSKVAHKSVVVAVLGLSKNLLSQTLKQFQSAHLGKLVTHKSCQTSSSSYSQTCRPHIPLQLLCLQFSLKWPSLGDKGRTKWTLSRRVGVDSEKCKPSVADQLQAMTAAWALCGTRTPAVGPPVRSEWDSRALRRRTRPHSRLCLSLSPSPSLGRSTKGHHCRVLPHARAPSSSRTSPIPSVRSTPMPSSTNSTPSLDHLSEGEAALVNSATAAMSGTSPEYMAAMVGVARTLPILPFSLH